MSKLKIGGVNEHFNMPWKLMFQSEAYRESGITASWKDYPGGTGAMVEDLNKGNLDMAVLLTEGAIKAIHEGGQFKILTFFVTSPLIWGIHVSASSPLKNLEQIKGKKYAISRYGSGSHIMSFVNARRQNWPVDDLNFELVNDLNGARVALKEREADVFLWEKFTTHPLVESGEFRRIGEYPTPYDCFVVAVSHKAMAERRAEVDQIMNLAFMNCSLLEQMPDKVELISESYGLTVELVSEWLISTRWASSYQINTEDIVLAKKILRELDLIKTELPDSELIW